MNIGAEIQARYRSPRFSGAGYTGHVADDPDTDAYLQLRAIKRREDARIHEMKQRFNDVMEMELFPAG